MTTQLTLITLPAEPARPAGERVGTTPEVPAPARPIGTPTATPAPATPAAERRPHQGPTALPTDPSAARRRRPSGSWRLDGRTIRSGQKGLAAARAALADASRRAQARDEERDARRQEELARQADLLRHPAGHRAA